MGFYRADKIKKLRFLTSNAAIPRWKYATFAERSRSEQSLNIFWRVTSSGSSRLRSMNVTASSKNSIR
jgi:hypothetical protein